MVKTKIKEVVCYDVETTGLSTKEDYIIQLSLMVFDLDSFQIKDKRSWYIKPIGNYTINPQAQAAHGLTKEFIEANGVPLKSIADEVLGIFENRDILSYNGNTFDIQFMIKDFKLIGKEFKTSGKKFYDSYIIESKLFPRNLSAVYKKYTGQDMQGAHDASNDVLATYYIFRNQIEQNKLSIKELNEWNEFDMMFPDGLLRNASTPGDPEHIVFTKGKYKDVDFVDVCKRDPGYIKWYFESIATAEAKVYLEKYYRKMTKSGKK